MTERLTEAFELAARLHREQKRKGTEIPYLSHLMAVAALVQENGGDEDQVIAALLHDVPEDQGGEATLGDIRERFGDRVANIVAECSDTFEVPKPPWEARKQTYLDHLASASEETLLVSLADKVHNLGCILRDYRAHGENLWSRFKTGREGILWYYERLIQVYTGRRSPQFDDLISELGRSMHQLSELIEASKVESTGKTTVGKFTVLVDDNYHYMDESERRFAGTFDAFEVAVARCKDIVDASLRDCHEPGMTASELFGRYKMFGEDPFIKTDDPVGGSFSAWEYAEEKAKEICPAEAPPLE